MTKKRDSWASRAAFLFAAIGSAVGLGNAWRFPGLAALHGGGTFLFVYIIAMFLLGWPLLMMEIGMGRKMRKGAPGAMKGVNKNAEFVGWAAVTNAFFICAYYSAILAWIVVMIVKSFKLGGLGQEAAGNIFFDEVLKYSTISDGVAGLNIPWELLGALIICWIIVYVCIRRGAHSAGKITPYLVMVPVVLLSILAINGIVKDVQIAGGAGLKKFFLPDWTAFNNPTLWIDAFGQVFYSISIMMAIMIAYGSYVDKDANIVQDTLIISCADLLVSTIAGIVLFTTLSGTGMLDSYLANVSGGIGTAFVVYPKAMVLLSNTPWFNSMMSVFFYLTLLTLAIDSAYSIVEGIASSIADKFKLDPKKVRLGVCSACALVSLLFITKEGLDWLDIVDHWANAYSLMTVGIIECIVVGWFFKTSYLRDELNRTTKKFKIGAAYDWIVKLVGPLILTVLFVWALVGEIQGYVNPPEGAANPGYGGYPIWAQFLGGWIPFILIYVVGIVIQVLSNRNQKMMALEADFESWEMKVMREQEEIVKKVTETIEEDNAEECPACKLLAEMEAEEANTAKIDVEKEKEILAEEEDHGCTDGACEIKFSKKEDEVKEDKPKDEK